MGQRWNHTVTHVCMCGDELLDAWPGTESKDMRPWLPPGTISFTSVSTSCRSSVAMKMTAPTPQREFECHLPSVAASVMHARTDAKVTCNLRRRLGMA